MKLVRIDEVQGGEVLAREVMTGDYQILIGKGTVIKKEYIEKLKELDILSVYIEEECISEEDDESNILKEEVKADCVVKIKNVLEKHMYSKNSQLEKVNAAAEEVLTNILNDSHVTKKVYEIKARNSDIYEHSISVCSLAILTSLHMGLKSSIIHEIGIASLLHDLGLRFITVNYSDTDIEKLPDKEKEEYKKHTIYGYSAVMKEGWISENVKKMILFHHERMDGQGYPLHTKDTSIGCQILALCEAFDELLCGVGCVKMKVYEAIEYIKMQRGKSFVGEIVDVLLNFVAMYPTGTKVRLSNGAIGITFSQNENFPDRPNIRLITDENGNPCNDGQVISLLKVLNLVIDEVLN